MRPDYDREDLPVGALVMVWVSLVICFILVSIAVIWAVAS